MDELVSIIMPSYNTANYIAASIQSVLDQTYQNWELLLVDDCSTDDTDAVVAPFLSDARIRYLKNDRNSGAAISRNRALREAKGRWIAFLDSDDLWYPTKLEAQLKRRSHAEKQALIAHPECLEGYTPLEAAALTVAWRPAT